MVIIPLDCLRQSILARDWLENSRWRQKNTFVKVMFTENDLKKEIRWSNIASMIKNIKTIHNVKPLKA